MILLFGDPHGEFAYINETVEKWKPSAIILLGDMEAARPLDEELTPAMDSTEVWWIPGNHDTDSQRSYANLFESKLADRNLHGRVVEISGLRVAGLGGVFRGEVWTPPNAPQFQSFAALEKASRNRPIAKHERTQRALKHTSTIFPETVERLARLRAEVLVTHEAPSCHPHGFKTIDELARSMRVQHVFHGHHHDHRNYESAWPALGFKAFGVGLRDVVDGCGGIYRVHV